MGGLDVWPSADPLTQPLLGYHFIQYSSDNKEELRESVETMALYRNGIAVALITSIVYQLFLKNLIWVTLGVGRDVQPIADFPYKCRKIQDPRLQACEDMYLSEDTRQLFLACSDPASRKDWMPK